MKKIYFLFIAYLCTYPCLAQDTIPTKSKWKSNNVIKTDLIGYFRGQTSFSYERVLTNNISIMATYGQGKRTITGEKAEEALVHKTGGVGFPCTQEIITHSIFSIEPRYYISFKRYRIPAGFHIGPSIYFSKGTETFTSTGNVYSNVAGTNLGIYTITTKAKKTAFLITRGTTGTNIFVLKMDANGLIKWAKRAPAYDTKGIDVDNSGNCYIVGQTYYGTKLFDSVTVIGNNKKTGSFLGKIDTTKQFFSIGGIKPTQPRCFGDCNGSAVTCALGGTPPYTYQWNGITGTDSIPNLCAGNYLLQVKDAVGAVDTMSLKLVQPPLLKIQFTSITNTSSCSAQTGKIKSVASGGTPGYTYKWSPNTFTGTDPVNLGVGTYTLTVKDFNGCITSDSAKITCPTGMEEVENGNALNVFPNPSSGMVTISCTERNGEIRIINALGEQIYSLKNLSEQLNVDLSEQSNGLYFIQFIKEGVIQETKKIILEH